jgi:1-phosphatidylinositol-3-phosphate 5-kinase
MDALTKFAPSYFDYMRQTLAHGVSDGARTLLRGSLELICTTPIQRPTCLAKIYGFFKIGYRNATTGRSLRMNVLIMENLFYERRFDRVGNGFAPAVQRFVLR